MENLKDVPVLEQLLRRMIGAGAISLVAAYALQTAYRWYNGREVSYGDAYATSFIGYMICGLICTVVELFLGSSLSATGQANHVILIDLSASSLVFGIIVSIRHELGFFRGQIIGFLMQILFYALFLGLLCCGAAGFAAVFRIGTR